MKDVQDINNSMRLVNVKIRRYPNVVTGVYLGEGEQWLKIEENVVDYVLDGLLYINKDYIEEVTEVSSEELKTKVISCKEVGDVLKKGDSYNDILDTFKESHVLLAIGLQHQQKIVVGYVMELHETYLVFMPISKDLRMLSNIKIDIQRIRYMATSSDYLSSITNYFNKNKQKVFF